MRLLAFAVTAGTMMGPFASAQQGENLPTELKIITAGDVKIRYLNFKWDEEAFEAMEQGTGAPAGTRSWALARILTPEPLEIDGRPITGGSLLVLNPARGDTPMTLEVRVIDMRDVFTDMNVIAEPPPGETVHREPAGFEAVDTLADRLTLHLQEDGGTYTLSIHYGNRRAALTATR